LNNYTLKILFVPCMAQIIYNQITQSIIITNQ
jgi:hypothetical protein